MARPHCRSLRSRQALVSQRPLSRMSIAPTPRSKRLHFRPNRHLPISDLLQLRATLYPPPTSPFLGPPHLPPLVTFVRRPQPQASSSAASPSRRPPSKSKPPLFASWTTESSGESKSHISAVVGARALSSCLINRWRWDPSCRRFEALRLTVARFLFNRTAHCRPSGPLHNNRQPARFVAGLQAQSAV
jgi:hypothetical protein